MSSSGVNSFTFALPVGQGTSATQRRRGGERGLRAGGRDPLVVSATPVSGLSSLSITPTSVPVKKDKGQRQRHQDA